jgi:phosphoribosylanthranilate isomerase
MPNGASRIRIDVSNCYFECDSQQRFSYASRLFSTIHTMRTRVKICGITRPEDAMAAIAHGCDAIGLVFYDPSPRNVSIPQAQAICAALPPFVTVVGLFVDAKPAWIAEVKASVPLGLLQFHGDETAAQCASHGMPYMKAVRVKPGLNLLQYAADHAAAQALLLDAYAEGVAGGTGQTFDWSLIPQNMPKPVVLAGGLTPENVTEAIRLVRPYGIDVSGGVEQSKGIKDAVKLAAFMRGVSDASL